MDIYLHHYPPSLFSEKIRLMLGYLGLPWKSVIIPSIMPRPLLMPLSGGYRRTPVLQIGANVYCDSRIIARALARHAGDTTLYAHGFTAHRVADWADSHLFQVTVAMNFSPKAAAAMMGSFPPEEAAAFARDRAELTQGAAISTLAYEAAAASARHYLTELDGSVGSAFLFGTRPCIADFSVYHCLWFLNNNPVNAKLLEDFPAVGEWMARMAAFGHGRVEAVDGAAALAGARAENPELPALENRLPEGFALGDPVTVTPVDYGRIPVAGRLVAWSSEEVVIDRETAETGRVFVHFPSSGFEVRQAS
ncbi:MAG: glutathione S-transferase family protein [Pseudomonadales bacterium]|nr:glutathione S-transferase family protein [Pseudomonadales bacterium]